MAKSIEEQMLEKGYVKVNGMAILNDVAITNLSDGKVLSTALISRKSVDIFNSEFDGDWQIYRIKPSKLH